MNELIEKARKKIEEEMKKSNDSCIKEIGKYLLKQIDINAEAAKAINDETKTLKKALEEMRKIAQGKAVRGQYYMPDEEVFEITRNYFEIEAVQDKMFQVKTEEIEIKHDIIEEEQKENVDFNYSLEDFM